MQKLQKIWNERDITLNAKKRIAKTLVLLYSAEACIIKNKILGAYIAFSFGARDESSAIYSFGRQVGLNLFMVRRISFSKMLLDIKRFLVQISAIQIGLRYGPMNERVQVRLILHGVMTK